MITFNNVTVHPSGCASPILKHIDLTIGTGITCIIGPSGAGKSTLLRCINGLVVPTQGTIRVDQHTLHKNDRAALRTIRQNIGMVFQHGHLLQHATVMENICLPTKLGRPTPKHLDVLLEKTGLTHLVHHRPHQLSGGQQQRVAIARALAHNPTLLLCDEPTSALDPDTTHKIMALLHELHHTFGMPLIMVCHDLDQVKKWADDVVVIDQGCVVEHQRLRALLRNPQSDLSKHWLVHQQLPPLPKDVVASCPSQTLLHLYFQGQDTLAPLLANFNDLFGVKTSILQAKVSCIQDQILGAMTIALEQPHPPLASLLQYWQTHEVLAQRYTAEPEHPYD